jgi:hypothetical protein
MESLKYKCDEDTFIITNEALDEAEEHLGSRACKSVDIIYHGISNISSALLYCGLDRQLRQTVSI